MNPIPLTSPSGAIYAYACGRCHHVSAGSAMLVVPDEPGPIELLVESSLRGATHCCHCYYCGIAPLTGDARTGVCNGCDRTLAWRRMWEGISYCMARGITDSHAYEVARHADWKRDMEDLE